MTFFNSRSTSKAFYLIILYCPLSTNINTLEGMTLSVIPYSDLKCLIFLFSIIQVLPQWKETIWIQIFHQVEFIFRCSPMKEWMGIFRKFKSFLVFHDGDQLSPHSSHNFHVAHDLNDSFRQIKGRSCNSFLLI